MADSEMHSPPPAAGGRVLLCAEPSLYQHFLEADGGRVLEVEVNRAASYTVRFRLDEAETARFLAEGESFVRSLALKVDSFPEFFRDRAL